MYQLNAQLNYVIYFPLKPAQLHTHKFASMHVPCFCNGFRKSTTV